MVALSRVPISRLCIHQILRSFCKQPYKNAEFYFHPTFSSVEEQECIRRDFSVLPDFLSETEETQLLAEIEPVLKRLRYEADHWDAAILGYRETEKRDWKPHNLAVLQRVRQVAFKNRASMPLVHVLDLKEEGVIKPHVDSIKFCGNIITGLSLLTTSVMRLSKESDNTKTVDVLLPRRSLYIMTGTARYDYSHAVLGNEDSFFNGNPVKKTRRISVICRNDPAES